jgi:hypothetical protein
LFSSVIKVIDKIFNFKLLDEWGDTGVEWIKKQGLWFGKLVDDANRWLTAFSESDGIIIMVRKDIT